jgi:hypothetical protein
MSVKVTVRCVSCQGTREVGPGEVPAGDIPMCPTCFMPMVAVSAQATTGAARYGR